MGLSYQFAILLLALALQQNQQAVAQQSITAGVLDLRGWDFETQAVVPLEGQWEFYWSKLLEPADFQHQIIENIDYIKVPGSWSQAVA